LIHKEGGILSVDDTVIEKLYSDPKSAELVNYFWSGKFHQTIKGINLITLYYSDLDGNSVPVNYRIDDKSDATPRLRKAQGNAHQDGRKNEKRLFSRNVNGSAYLGVKAEASDRR
jgi:hypothetical protein